VTGPFRCGMPPVKYSAIVGLARDITERRQLEEQLRQSQKMEALGQLAGGVAHDFNNLLAVIQGHASLLASQSNLPQTARDSANAISLAAESAASLTRPTAYFSAAARSSNARFEFE